ncbi:hypothetical protein QJS04_geneDACA020775 [Acorus gramineus]|uniref:Rab-GAP TBC domain-containing protein n=1 Tax=Acorus gramineus TaxID=55184 RepID=A0AAV9A6J1_ACOGR|nr:hypothetical protein QJS04_geneDACA020775 [Acorus gramineus]
MVKKGVPEWLNSSLWSSPTAASAAVEDTDDNHPLHRHRVSVKSPGTSSRREPSPPPPHPPPPPPPEPVEETTFVESEGPGFSADEISRQAQLLAELLLGYLPKDRGLWASELEKKRSQYAVFKEELLVNPDTEIIEQIDRDVKRTHPDMHFFSGDSPSAKANQESFRRILIIFAKLNPGIRYVQGMNEVLAPLFYVFRNDPDEDNAAAAEADTFFCFVELLSGFRDNFCQQLDNSVVGIRSTITRLSQLLKKHDEELWRHLEVTTKVNPQFYAFRWITLLLTQEFNFADSLHIWDTLLSDPEGPQETLLRVCCAMLVLIRRRLLAGDFTANLKLLQNYPPTNIGHLLYVANKLRAHPAR